MHASKPAGSSPLRRPTIAGGAARVVSTRTAPPLPPANFVDRPRLRDTLAGAVPLGVAVIVAPGGFGKTVALADFAMKASFPVAWLTVSPADGDLVAFVDALAAAVRRVVPGFGRGAAKMARQTGTAAIAALADELAGELLDHGAPLGLILDDFHTVDGAADVVRLVAAFVERAPSNCFVAIASRTLPALPHARLIATGRMLGVAADELRFTVDETATFLQAARDDARVARLHETTGGWAAALALGEGSTAYPSVLDDYLEYEVFGQQSPDVRDFLLRASVPPTLNEDVCRRVLGVPMGPIYLSRAHRAGLFVAALPDGGWRLHDLFRDFLRARLRRNDPTLWEQLNRAVAEELVAARRPADAVTLLASADLFDDAADVLLRHADNFAAEGRWGAIRHWMDQLPQRIVHARPRLLTLQGRALMPSSPAIATGLFDRAVDACLAAEDEIGAAEALTYRSTRLMISGRHTEASQDCARAHELVGQRSHPVLATILRIQGTIAARSNSFDAAFAQLRAALTVAEQYRDRPLIAICERALGWVHSYSGDPGAATAHYERGARIWEELGDLGALAEVRISLGHTYAEQGAVDLARTCFQRALDLGERLGQTRVQAFALDNLAALDRDAGDIDRAIGRLGVALALARQSDDAYLLALCIEQLARCHLIGGSGPATAEALARQALAEAERGTFAPVAARANATLSAAILAQGRTAEALVTAREAASALAGIGQRADLVRASLVGAVAGYALGDEGWLGDLTRADAALTRVRNRAFLRADVAALGDALREMAHEPAVRRSVEAILTAGDATPPGPAVETSLSVAAHPTLPRIQAKLLGRPRLLVDGMPPRDPGQFWRRRPIRLLFFLLEWQRPGLRSDTIVDRLWPDEEPGRAQSLLWDTAHRLRSLLSGADRRRGREILTHEGGIYRLHPDLPLSTDVAAFEAAAGRGLAAAPGSAEEGKALAMADALYAGPYLEGVEESWTIRRRGALARLDARVLRRLAERALVHGTPQDAVELAERLARAQPLAESACQLHIQALLAANDRDRAREVYRAFARRLGRTLDADPSPKLAALVGLGGGGAGN